MAFASLHKNVTYLIAGLGLYSLTLGGELSGAPAVLTALLFFASAFAEGPMIHRRWWIRGGNAVAVLGLLGQALGATLGRSLLTVGVEYAAFLQVILLFNRRTARDHQQIALLALLHLIASTVLSVEFGFALAFLGFVLGMPWMLALSHLRRAIESQEGGSTILHLRSRDVVGPRFLAATALVTLPIFVVTLALFVAFPRVGLGFLPLSARSGQPTTGFGGSVQLGGFGTLRADPTVVLRFRTDGRRDILPARFRGTSFDRYDGRSWVRTQALEFEPLARSGTQYPIVRTRRPDDQTYRIALDPIDEPVVFLPRGTVSLMFPPRGPFGGATGRQLELRSGLDLRYHDRPGTSFRYTAFVSDRFPVPEELAEPERDRYLQLPSKQEAEGIGRVVELARSLTNGIDSPRGRAERISTWLRDSGRFHYTLELPDTAGKDPLEVFLFEARAGHCEYFSTALSILLRAVGVPSRNATGFVGGHYNSYGGYYAIRQADAHSWVEAYIDGAWRTYDPTPSAAIAAGPSGGLLGELRAVVDAIRTRWARNVVAYDLRQQLSFFRALGRRFRGWFARSPRDSTRHAGESSSLFDESPVGSGFGWVGAICFIVLLTLGLWIGFRRRPRPEAPATRLYRELDRALAKCGAPRPPSRTPLEHASRLKEAHFEGAEVVSRVTRRYLEARYGGATLTHSDLSDLRRAVASVGKARSGAGSPSRISSGLGPGGVD